MIQSYDKNITEKSFIVIHARMTTLIKFLYYLQKPKYKLVLHLHPCTGVSVQGYHLFEEPFCVNKKKLHFQQEYNQIKF